MELIDPIWWHQPLAFITFFGGTALCGAIAYAMCRAVNWFFDEMKGVSKN